jgi:hypothetical protein
VRNLTAFQAVVNTTGDSPSVPPCGGRRIGRAGRATNLSETPRARMLLAGWYAAISSDGRIEQPHHDFLFSAILFNFYYLSYNGSINNHLLVLIYFSTHFSDNRQVYARMTTIQDGLRANR